MTKPKFDPNNARTWEDPGLTVCKECGEPLGHQVKTYKHTGPGRHQIEFRARTQLEENANRLG